MGSTQTAVESARKREAGQDGTGQTARALARAVQQLSLNLVGRRTSPTFCDPVAEALLHHSTVRGGPPRGDDELLWRLAEFVVGYLVT